MQPGKSYRSKSTYVLVPAYPSGLWPAVANHEVSVATRATKPCPETAPRQIAKAHWWSLVLSACEARARQATLSPIQGHGMFAAAAPTGHNACLGRQKTQKYPGEQSFELDDAGRTELTPAMPSWSSTRAYIPFLRLFPFSQAFQSCSPSCPLRKCRRRDASHPPSGCLRSNSVGVLRSQHQLPLSLPSPPWNGNLHSQTGEAQ